MVRRGETDVSHHIEAENPLVLLKSQSQIPADIVESNDSFAPWVLEAKMN